MAACGGGGGYGGGDGGGGGGGAPPSTPYTIGGSVSGLTGTVVLQNNAGDDLSVATNGPFRFAGTVASGGAYSVTIRTQPANQSCSVVNGSSTVATANITDVAVTCTTNSFPVTGSVTGLAGSGLVLQNNGGDDLEVGVDGAFNFPTHVASGGAYSVTVLRQPFNPVQSCTVANGSGEVANEDVTAPIVTCAIQFARFAYVANAGDNSISVYTVDAVTGQLRHRGHVPTGQAPFAVTVHPSGRFAYVPNSESSSVSQFTIDAITGALTPTGEVDTGQEPHSVAVEPLGRFAYVVSLGDDSVTPFGIDPESGALAPLPDSFRVTAGQEPIAAAVDPSGRFVYVANSQSTTVSAYRIESNGALTELDGSPFEAQIGPQSITFDPSGRFVYVTNAGSISIYRMSDDGALVEVQDSLVTHDMEISPMSLHPSGRFAHVLLFQEDKILTYRIDDDGRMVASNEVPVEDRTDMVRIDPSGKFLYATNESSNTVAVLSIDSTNGALTHVGLVASRTSPVDMAVTGGDRPVTYAPKFAYVGNLLSPSVFPYAIDPVSGALEPMMKRDTGSPGSVALDPLGRFLYVVRNIRVSAFPIDPASGALGTNVETNMGFFPLAAAVDPSGEFALVAGTFPNSVTRFPINPVSGALELPGSNLPQPGLTPIAVAVDPTGRFMYVANSGSDNVSAFPITSTGQRVDSAAGDSPASVAVHPTGRFVYVANQGSHDVSRFTIASVSGILEPKPGAPAVDGARPGGVSVHPTGRFLYVVTRTGVWVFPIDPVSGSLGQRADFPIPTIIAASIDPSGKFLLATKENAGAGTISVFLIDPTTGAPGAQVGGDLPAGEFPNSIAITTVLQ